MDHQENRIVHVLAPHFDPLIYAADTHRIEAVDALQRRYGPLFGNLML